MFSSLLKNKLSISFYTILINPVTTLTLSISLTLKLKVRFCFWSVNCLLIEKILFRRQTKKNVLKILRKKESILLSVLLSKLLTRIGVLLIYTVRRLQYTFIIHV